MGSGRRSKEGETTLEDNILDNINNIFDNIDDILNNIFVDTNHNTLCADLKIHISVSHFAGASQRRIVTSLNSRLRVSIMLETQQGKEEEAEGGEEEEESITQKVVIMFIMFIIIMVMIVRHSGKNAQRNCSFLDIIGTYYMSVGHLVWMIRILKVHCVNK